ncbi:serine hydrolase [Dactylosporangium maewongense]|uniref:Serine hydrolase n=1 Tax=Dactylosporangium maewongense TaxID=634393 RepID=A0ABN2A2I1_9ACTN
MTRRQRIDDLPTLAAPEQPAVAPDGSRVVYVLRTVDAGADRTLHNLWWAGTRSGGPEQLTRGGADTAPAWSPDGTRIAFLRAGGGTTGGAAQVWLLPAGGGEPEQLTTLPLGAGRPVWSPDGTAIAFAAPVDLHASDGEDDAARQRRGAAPIVADRLDYLADGAGYLRTMRSHVHVVDVATKACRRFTDGDWHAGDPAWSPDGTRLAYAAATAPDADRTMHCPVYVRSATDPAAPPRLAGLTDGTGGPVTWAADGGTLLVTGFPGPLTGHAHLLRVPLDGGPVTSLSAPLDRNVMPGGPGYPGALPVTVDSGRSVLFCARDRGDTHLYTVPVGGGDPRPVLAGAGRSVAGLSVAGGTAVVLLLTPTSLGSLVALDLSTGDETVLVQRDAEADLFPRLEREFTISDGTVVHGWLVRDPAATGPGPLLLDIHGGPHNAWNAAADDVHLYHQELAARGWTVLLLNPRGSDGYGEAFYTAAVGAWGVADAKDFLEPVDTLVAEGVADPARLAVAGYSYGGYMTCYLTGVTDRFAAAVAGGVVSDLTSESGTADAGHFLNAFELAGGSVADMSPITRVDQVRTPTLILHGAADVRCPAGQAQQWHTALRERDVPTRLVLYPDASHLFILQGRPSHRIDFNRRIVDWVERFAADREPRRPALDAAHWQRRLTALAQRHKVPGATLGILRLRPGADSGGDELVEATYGVVNKDTGVGSTTDSVFQIGSISKVWTATVVLQLVDEGLLDLDAPVADVLPEFRLADPEVTKQVTMRHLLTHTSGIDGDVFTDTGRGDDCLERYVALLAEQTQNHPLGVTWSYCNAGFSLAGRVIEKLTGGTWDAALRARLSGPLGLRRTGTLPEEALAHRTAIGHVGEDPDDLKVAPAWALPRSLGPAGLINATAADVLAFARLHLTGGLAADGTRVLSEASAAAMAAEHAELPDKYSLGDSWGLGWIRFGWDGHRLIGHDGNTIGQSAFLRLLPEQGLAVTLLTNGGNGRDLYDELYREIFAEAAGVAMPRPIAPPAEPVQVDFQRYLGTYERASVRIEVFERDGGPVMRSTVTGPIAELIPDPVSEYAMVPVEENLFLVKEPSAQNWAPVTFYALPTGEPYLHFGVRATPKVHNGH